jgi:hypothetical protein
MTPEDEEFQRISREIKRRSEEDDDIQDYKKPWVGLEDKEIELIATLFFPKSFAYKSRIENNFAKAIEQRLKDKNA